MTETNNNNTPVQDCGCSDPNCCQPKPRRPWQKIIFIAVIVLAAGLITFKLLNKPAAADCSKKGCCKDTTECCPKK